MATVIIGKSAPPKPFKFDALAKKVGEDNFTLAWDADMERFDFRKNGSLIVSDVGTQCCIRRARAMGVEFDVKPAVTLPVEKK